MKRSLDLQSTVKRKGSRSACLPVVLLAVAVTLPFGLARPAQAASGCDVQIIAASNVATGLELADIAGQTMWWNYYFLDIKDRLTRMANADSQDTTAQNNAGSTVTDKVSVDATSIGLAQGRTAKTLDYVPSRLTCSTITHMRAAVKTEANYNAARTVMTQASTRQSLNAPGSGTENGSLQAANTIWKERCNTYFDPATTPLPPGMSCPAASAAMKDLDISPWRSIFLPINIPGTPPSGVVPPLAKAAADTIRLLVEPVTPDPVRGVMLTRNEGQNIHVMRMRDLARMNMARGALEDIVARRVAPTTPDADGKMNSRVARYIEMISGQGVSGNSVAGMLNTLVAAGEASKNAQVQSVAARLQTEKMMLVDFLKFVNDWEAIEATKLAMTIDKTRAGQVSASMVANQGN